MCPFVSGRAQAALGDDLFMRILQAGPDSLLGTRGFMPEPDVQSAPSSSTILQYINFQPGDSVCPSEGEVFGDGSGSHGDVAVLSCAGFAVVQGGPSGDVVKYLRVRSQVPPAVFFDGRVCGLQRFLSGGQHGCLRWGL